MLKAQKFSPTAQSSKNCWDFQLWETLGITVCSVKAAILNLTRFDKSSESYQSTVWQVTSDAQIRDHYLLE